MIYLINSPSGDQYGVQGFKAQIPGYNDLEFEPIQVLGEGLYNSTTGSNITDSKDFAKYLYTVMLTNENKDEPTYDELKAMHERSVRTRTDTIPGQIGENDGVLEGLLSQLGIAGLAENTAWDDYEKLRSVKTKKAMIQRLGETRALIKKVQERIEYVRIHGSDMKSATSSRRPSVSKGNNDETPLITFAKRSRRTRGRGGKKRPVRARATNQGDDDDEDNIAEMLLNGSISKFEMNILHIKNGKASRSIVAVQANPATGALKFTEKSKTPVKIVP